MFLKQQDRLFPEPVAEGMEEAEAFLEDCMAVVVDSKAAVMEYLKKRESTWRTRIRCWTKQRFSTSEMGAT